MIKRQEKPFDIIGVKASNTKGLSFSHHWSGREDLNLLYAFYSLLYLTKTYDITELYKIDLSRLGVFFTGFLPP